MAKVLQTTSYIAHACLSRFVFARQELCSHRADIQQRRHSPSTAQSLTFIRNIVNAFVCNDNLYFKWMFDLKCISLVCQGLIRLRHESH